MSRLGSSEHFSFMQINWPSQSVRVRHGSLQEEMARLRWGRETSNRVRDDNNPKLPMKKGDVLFCFFK